MAWNLGARQRRRSDDPLSIFDIGDPNNRPSHFTFVFGGDYIVDELMQLIDWPPFVAAWNRLCVQFARVTPGSGYFQTRVVANAAGRPLLRCRLGRQRPGQRPLTTRSMPP